MTENLHFKSKNILSSIYLQESCNKHRFGFLQSPLFSKCQTGVTTDLINTSSEQMVQLTPRLSFKHGHGGDGSNPTEPGTQHKMAMFCQMQMQKPADSVISPRSLPKCVSQSSSSGLGSEHSGGGNTDHLSSIRCHCSTVTSNQNSGRIRRCRLRAHHHQHRLHRLEALNLPEGRMMESTEGDSLCSPVAACTGAITNINGQAQRVGGR